jgi:hypothetical protein
MSRNFAYASSVVLVLCACAGGSKPPTSPETDPEPKASATASASTPVPDDKTDTADAGKKPDKPKTISAASGAIMVTYNDVAQPQTVGSDGAVFHAGSGGELRIPVGALRETRNLLFTLDSKGKPTAGKLGAVFAVLVQMPDTQFKMGEVISSRPAQSSSDPFVIKLPLPAGANSANLAVETVAVNPKTSQPKSTWSVIAMSKLETSDTGNRAVFELPILPDGHVHLTSSAPSGN